MKIKAEWLLYLHNLRRRELALIFSRCPEKVFQKGLELGAGDGFQSALLAKYVSRLTSTDYNPGVLKLKRSESVEYRVCDAEKVGEAFRENEFDLVFSSNLLEHLPDPQQALGGIHKVLKVDGITIHVMPSQFWKLSHVGLYTANRLVGFVERRVQEFGLGRQVTKEGRVFSFENNPKTQKPKRSFLSSLLVPVPHGVSPTNIQEFEAFRRSRWEQEFARANFELVAVMKGPVSSGYGFGFDTIRRLLERLGFASEYIYIAVKKGERSPYRQYFEFGNPSGAASEVQSTLRSASRLGSRW